MLEEAELQATEQQRNIRRCYSCGSTRHLFSSCPLRKQRYTGRTIPLPQAVNPAREMKFSIFRCAGRPIGKELSSVEPLGGKGEQGLASEYVGETTKGEYKPVLLVALATAKGL